MRVMIAVTRRAGGDVGKLKLPERSEIVAGWALPAMAEALAEDEEEQRAIELLESVRNLKKR